MRRYLAPMPTSGESLLAKRRIRTSGKKMQAEAKTTDTPRTVRRLMRKRRPMESASPLPQY